MKELENDYKQKVDEVVWHINYFKINDSFNCISAFIFRAESFHVKTTKK